MLVCQEKWKIMISHCARITSSQKLLKKFRTLESNDGCSVVHSWSLRFGTVRSSSLQHTFSSWSYTTLRSNWHHAQQRGTTCFTGDMAFSALSLSPVLLILPQYSSSELQGIKLKSIAFNWWLNWSKKRLCIFLKWCAHLLCTLQVVNYVRSADLLDVETTLSPLLHVGSPTSQIETKWWAPLCWPAL